jgi:hypothetical protein
LMYGGFRSMAGRRRRRPVASLPAGPIPHRGATLYCTVALPGLSGTALTFEARAEIPGDGADPDINAPPFRQVAFAASSPD